MLQIVSTAFVVTIIVAALNFLLGLVVFMKNWHRPQNVFFAVFAWLMSAFILANYFSNYFGVGHNAVIWINRTVFFCPALALYFMFIFSLSLVNLWPKNFKPIAISTGLASLAVALIGASPLVVHDVRKLANVYETVPGPMLPVYFGYILVIATAIVAVLALGWRRQKGATRVRIGYVALSFFATAAVVITCDMILPLGFHNYAFSIYGPCGTLILVGGMTYTIIRHHLFDIRLVVTRSLAYLMLLFTLGIMYALLAFRLGSLIFHSAALSATQQTFNVAVAIVLAFTFQPLRRFFEKTTDRIFYRDKYDPQTLLNTLGTIMASEIELEHLGGDVIRELVHQMRLSMADLVVLDRGRLFFEAHTDNASQNPADIVTLAKLPATLVVSDETEPGPLKDILEQLHATVVVPLQSSTEHIGWLTLGEKRNGDIFNHTDIRTLTILANELAIAIHNAKSFTQIQHFNQTLQIRVAEATKQLRDANAHLQQLVVVKDEFISMASHQLGTPLTVLDGYISMLESGIYGPVSTKQHAPLDTALHRVRLMKRLVADFLNVSRMEAGRFFIEAAPTDLNKVVPEEVDMLKDRAIEKQTTLHFVPPVKPVPMVNIDEQKTRQAIMNLIDNAIFYTPNGLVKVTLNQEGNNVVFRVVDNGIGVPLSAQKQLFSKFFRAPNAKRERPNGTGIGLFLVKRVIEDQGGILIFESTEHKGSIFGFKLPIKVPMPVAVKAAINDKQGAPNEESKSKITQPA